MDIQDEKLAFEFDSALAYREMLREKDEEGYRMDAIMRRFDDVCKVFGAKIKKRPPYKPLLKPKLEKEELPTVEEVMKALGGKGVEIK